MRQTERARGGDTYREEERESTKGKNERRGIRREKRPFNIGRGRETVTP